MSSRRPRSIANAGSVLAPATPAKRTTRTREQFNATPSALPAISGKHSTSYGSSLAVSPMKMTRYEIDEDLDDILEGLVQPPPPPPPLPEVPANPAGTRGGTRRGGKTPSVVSQDISFANESGLFGDAVINSTPAQGGGRGGKRGRATKEVTVIPEVPEVPESEVTPPPIRKVPVRGKAAVAPAAPSIPEGPEPPEVPGPLWPSAVDRLWSEVHQIASQRKAARQRATSSWYHIPLLWLSSLYDIIELSWSRFGFSTIWRLPFRALVWISRRPWLLILMVSLVLTNTFIESDNFRNSKIGYHLRHYGIFEAKYYITSFVPHYITRPLNYFNEDDVLDLQKRMSEVEHKVATLNRRATFDEATLNYLKDHLPEFVLMKKDKHGNKVIPPNFWSALKAKIEAEPPLLKGKFFPPSHDKALPSQEISYKQVEKIAAGAWANFLDNNEVKIKAWQGEVFDEMWKDHVRDAYKNDVLVSRTEMIEEVQKAWDDSKSLINKEIGRFAKQLDRFMKEQEAANRTMHLGGVGTDGITASNARVIAREEAKKFGFVTEKDVRQLTKEELKNLVAVNEKKVREIANQVMQKVGGIGKAEARIIAQEELQQLESAKKSNAKETFAQELKNNEKYIRDQARVVSQHEAKGAILQANVLSQKDVRTISMAEIERMVPLVQIRSLIKAQMGKSVEQGKRRVNYFSVGVGVVVNPVLTSPTYAFNTRRAWFGTRALLYVLGSPVPEPHPPVEALTRWDEHGDCWCSPSSESGITLAVLTSKPLYPDEIVVEHISPEATLEPGTAPKDMILFAKIEGFNQQVIVLKLSEKFFINVVGAVPTDLDESWIPIAAFRYDLASGDSIQAFPVPIDLKGLNIPASQFIIRATDNWGRKDHTCLYRVSLHGEVATTKVSD